MSYVTGRARAILWNVLQLHMHRLARPKAAVSQERGWRLGSLQLASLIDRAGLGSPAEALHGDGTRLPHVARQTWARQPSEGSSLMATAAARPDADERDRGQHQHAAGLAVSAWRQVRCRHRSRRPRATVGWRCTRRVSAQPRASCRPSRARGRPAQARRDAEESTSTLRQQRDSLVSSST